MHDDTSTYSIMLRIRRITYEDTFVAVPVTEQIMESKDDGTLGINGEAFIAEAIRLSQNEGVDWRIESIDTEPHPLQTPKPADRHLTHAPIMP